MADCLPVYECKIKTVFAVPHIPIDIYIIGIYCAVFVYRIFVKYIERNPVYKQIGCPDCVLVEYAIAV